MPAEVTALVRYFEPQPSSVPARFASPFGDGTPHPLARRAADELAVRLRGLTCLDTPGGGKMFGVLVIAAPDGRIGYLAGFSGMLDGAWRVDGFVPPLYDAAARDAIWPAGQRALRGLELELRALIASPDAAALRTAHAAMAARHAGELDALRARHREHRDHRRAARAATTDAAALHAL